MPRPRPMPGDEVDGEDRQAEELVDQPQQQERQHDRKAAHEQRQQSRRPARGRPRTRAAAGSGRRTSRRDEVRCRAFVDFVEGDVVAAEAHAGRRELRAQAIDRRRGAVAVGERRQHDRLAPVARDQRGKVCGRVVDDALKARLGRQQRGDVRRLRAAPQVRCGRRRCWARARRRRSRPIARWRVRSRAAPAGSAPRDPGSQTIRSSAATRPARRTLPRAGTDTPAPISTRRVRPDASATSLEIIVLSLSRSPSASIISL